MEVIKTYRLIANEGKILTNGIVFGTVIDLAPDDNIENWQEIDIPLEETQENK